MNNDFCVIVQGPSDYVKELKNAWTGYDLIWSTWQGEESKYDTNDVVLFNSIPHDRGVQNIALQKISTLNGIMKAKEIGYNRVLKWRSDLLPSNANRLVSTFKKECVNFLTWHNDGKYFIDYFVEGEIDVIFNIWNVSTIHDEYSEKITTERILSLNYKNINFMGGELNNHNEIFWLKRNINLSTYKDAPCYSMMII